MKRRTLLRGLSAPGVSRLLATASAVLSQRAIAAEPDPFQAESVDAVMRMLGVSEPAVSDAIAIDVPKVAEDGSTVPVNIESQIPRTVAIFTIVSGNPRPLAAKHRLGPKAVAAVGSRVKMRKTSEVIVIVEADGRHYLAKREVKVTLGGCGG